MITWKFEELPVTFKSKQANLIRDISKMAHANHIDPSSKITIIDINGDTNKHLPTDDLGSNGDTSSVLQPTVPVGTKKVKAGKSEADVLPTVPGDVDNVDIEPELLDILDSFGDTGESGNWLDSKPDGQDTH
jgi:hypothetical protein